MNKPDNPDGQVWIQIAADVSDLHFSPENLAEIEVQGKQICLGLHAGRLFACSNKCPHAGGKLAGGYIDALGHVVCPVHRYKFNPKNGYNVSGEGYFLKTYPVQVNAEGVFLLMEYI
jgi:nitrite reductase/ring-hydroxylating ferredoxin subunit